MVSGSIDGDIFISNYETGKALQKIGKSEYSIESLIFCKVLDVIIVGGVESIVRIFNNNSYTQRNELKLESAISKIILVSREKCLLACGTSDGFVHIFDYRQINSTI